MAAAVQGDTNSDLITGSPFDLGAAETGKRKSRVPEILVGTFLVALFALGGAWFYSTSTASVGYLGLRQDVERGDVLEVDDLAVYELTTDAPLLGLSPRDQGLVLGQVAVSDMKSGSLISVDQFTDQAQIPPGAGVVGLQLSPGEYPSQSMRPGDIVRVVILPESGVPISDDQELLVVEDAEVIEVVDLSGIGRFVSLVMSRQDADLVAVAHARDRARLIQVEAEATG